MESTQGTAQSLSTSASTKTLTAGCYCKAVNFTITVNISDLPLPVHLCSCSICRHTHGTLCTFHAPLPSGVSPQFIAPSSIEGALTGYRYSDKPPAEGGPCSERFFCSTCSCHVGDRDLEPNADGWFEWRVASSIFSDHRPDDFRIQTHVYADPATQGPGGMVEWLPAIGDRAMKIWNPEPADRLGAPEPPKQEFDAVGNEVLRAECHCGGVSFTIPRPTRPETVDDEYLRRWPSSVDATKWPACLDACNDCRLMDGTHVLGWMFAPLAQTVPRVPPEFDGFGTLRGYESSKDVRRGFCGVCGATVFFSHTSRTPTVERQVVDIAVGILRAPEGIAAEKWLTWRTARVANIPSARQYDAEFVDSLGVGHAAWGRKFHGEAVDFSVP